MATRAAIVVIDDNQRVRQSLRALLEASGFAVQEFASAQTFLAADSGSAGDCLLVDVHMPGMTGLELQAELVRRKVVVPVIVITGQGDVPLAVAAMKAGAFDFIEKPYDEALLLDSIRRALEAGRHRRAGAAEAREAQDRIALLTDREREVFDHLALGKSNKIVGHDLRISPRTVEIHRARIMDKLKARGLSDLVRMARAAGAHRT